MRFSSFAVVAASVLLMLQCGAITDVEARPARLGDPVFDPAWKLPSYVDRFAANATCATTRPAPSPCYSLLKSHSCVANDVCGWCPRYQLCSPGDADGPTDGVLGCEPDITIAYVGGAASWQFGSITLPPLFDASALPPRRRLYSTVTYADADTDIDDGPEKSKSVLVDAFADHRKDTKEADDGDADAKAENPGANPWGRCVYDDLAEFAVPHALREYTTDAWKPNALFDEHFRAESARNGLAPNRGRLLPTTALGGGEAFLPQLYTVETAGATPQANEAFTSNPRHKSTDVLHLAQTVDIGARASNRHTNGDFAFAYSIWLSRLALHDSSNDLASPARNNVVTAASRRALSGVQERLLVARNRAAHAYKDALSAHGCVEPRVKSAVCTAARAALGAFDAWVNDNDGGGCALKCCR
jgi:hypothetical protein